MKYPPDEDKNVFSKWLLKGCYTGASSMISLSALNQTQTIIKTGFLK